ncbi:MAG: hypothetical protein HYT31_04585 [Parcubacteria group bacterium]|nr:hypothetical protein [Parcubacteria group bacterium]
MTFPSNKRAERLFASIKPDAGNPYVFSAHRIAAPKASRGLRRIASELDMVREQHQTLFEYDEAIQEIFGGDFEEYFKVIENPELLGARASAPTFPELAEMLSEPDDAEGEGDALPFESDALYLQAANWAEGLHELGHALYDHRGVRDPDVFRVTINSLLVSSKIAYALDIDEEELVREDAEVFRAEMEVSMRAYTLAAIFLQRVRESLKRLVRKRVAPAREWARSLGTTDALAAEITSRILGLSRKLHHSAD